MRITKRRSALAVVTTAALVLAACSSDEDGGGESSTAADANASDINDTERDEIEDGGELTLPITEVAEQQNTFHADGTLYTRDIWKWYNPQIALFDAEGEFQPNPDYLEDVSEEEVDGKTQVTYTINEEAEYNDGTPINWETFEHTWKFNNGEDEELNVSSTDGYSLIESVEEGENDKQAVVTFTQPYAWWEGLFNYLLPTQVDTPEKFNEGYLKETPNDWGAGPYKIESSDFNRQTVTFVPNENWWGEEPKLDTFTYRQMEAQAAINAFEAGEIDATSAATADRLATVRAMGDDADIRTAMRPDSFLITLNSEAPLLEDDAVREAIMTGVDRDQLAEIRFNGLDYTEDLPGSFIQFPTQEGYEDNLGEVLEYDPEKAKSLLNEAGWEEGSDGVREKDGEKLAPRYVLTGDDPQTKAEASAFQAMMRDIGVDMTIDERPSSEFANITSQRDFDIFQSGFSSSDPFGVAYFDQMFGSDSELNKSGTGTEEFDEKIAELQKIGDGDEQIAEANELEKEILGTYGIMPTYNGPDIQATKPGLANYGAYGFADVPVENIGWEAE
ncbi:MAG: ABC transporter family substrate-binding protein [Mycobacteriaceae bacterium]|uniref:ABC transporter family substrate-binding protein n=1 Tax=Corynebacterium sp. TaxID=1720 RepID=UPI003F97B049